MRRALAEMHTLLISVLLAMSAAAHAAPPLARIQTTPLAGFQYHAGPTVLGELREGDVLELALERDNAHDAQAVRVLWRGHMLGYLPRRENGAVARLLASEGAALQARIDRLQTDARPQPRISIGIWLPLGSSQGKAP